MAAMPALGDPRIGGQGGGQVKLQAHMPRVSMNSEACALKSGSDEQQPGAAYFAAASITRATAAACETKTAWLAGSSVTLAPERLYIQR